MVMILEDKLSGLEQKREYWLNNIFFSIWNEGTSLSDRDIGARTRALEKMVKTLENELD